MRFIPYSTSTIIQTRIQKENRNALSFLACHSLKKDCNAKKWPVLFYTTIFPPKTYFYERNISKTISTIVSTAVIFEFKLLYCLLTT